MCARVSQSMKTASKIQSLFSTDVVREFSFANSVSPVVAGGNVLIIASRGNDQNPKGYETVLTPCQWGVDMGNNLLFNARFETLGLRPTWRESVQDQRILVPVDSFTERGKTYTVKDKEVFCLAGITILVPQGHHAAMVATRNSSFPVNLIHHRMPVIVPEFLWTDWLDPKVPFISFEHLSTDHVELVGV